MKTEERVAHSFLMSAGPGVPTHEPDGNMPPDFVLASGVAIEVRRLNHNHFGSNKVQGLEKDHFRLNGVVENVLREFDTDEPGDCYWVDLTYERPIGNLKQVRRQTRNVIETFLVDPGSTPSRIRLTDTVSIELQKAGRRDTERFRVGSESDQDSGGWVVPLYVENIRFCLQEKEEKVRPYLSRYSEWWLILVDALLGIVPRDCQTVVEGVGKSHVFSRVVVIHLESGKKLFEI